MYICMYLSYTISHSASTAKCIVIRKFWHMKKNYFLANMWIWHNVLSTRTRPAYINRHSRRFYTRLFAPRSCNINLQRRAFTHRLQITLQTSNCRSVFIFFDDRFCNKCLADAVIYWVLLVTCSMYYKMRAHGGTLRFHLYFQITDKLS